MDLNYTVYEGGKPFIFISYAHKDSERVLPIIEALQAQGYRVWFDEGINAGSEFADYIAERLKNCSCFIAFISKNYLVSDFCNREIQYSLQKKRPLIPIYLEEAELPAGLEMQLSPIQALFFHNGMRPDRFMQELKKSEKIKPCREGVPVPVPDIPEPPRPTPITPARKPAKKRKSPLPIILVLLVLILAAGAVCMFANPFGHEDGSMYARLTATATPTPTPTPTPSPTPTAVPTAVPTATPAPTADTRYLNNVLMSNGFEDAEAEKDEFIFNTGAKRREVATITFLDTLANAPEDAADASLYQDGSVKAWAIKNGELYDLYIAADGGVSAPENSFGTFLLMPNLTSIEFGGAFHTEQAEDMHSMFYGCERLAELNLSGFDTSNVQNMYSMFYNCSSLTDLDLSGFDTSNVQDMLAMFQDCTALTTLTLGDQFDTSNVQNMQSMFAHCKSLKKLEISHFKTEQVTTMRHMFCGCEALTELNLSKFNTSLVEDMSQMFKSCPSLRTVEMAGFDTAKVTTMSNMFYGCNALTDLKINNFNVSSVTDYEKFMPDGKTVNGKLWKTYFTGTLMCNPVSNYDEEPDEPIFNTGVPRREVQTITFLDTLANAPEDAADASLNQDGKVKAWTEKNDNGFYDLYIAAEGGVSAPEDSSDLFCMMPKMTHIEFGNAFHTESVKDMSCMFYKSFKLNSLNLESFDTAKVENMSWMFSECKALDDITLSEKFDTRHVKKMFAMFSGCSNLTSLILPEKFDTTSVNDVSYMFNVCENLDDVIMPGFDEDYLPSKYDYFMPDGKTLNGKPWQEYFE